MSWFNRFTAWLDARERADERRTLRRELDMLDRLTAHRKPQIIARLEKLRLADQQASYGQAHFPARRFSIVEDDCGIPEGLVGEWKAPA